MRSRAVLPMLPAAGLHTTLAAVHVASRGEAERTAPRRGMAQVPALRCAGAIPAATDRALARLERTRSSAR